MTSDKLLKRIRKGKYKPGARFHIIRYGKKDPYCYIKYAITEDEVKEFFLVETNTNIPDSRFDTSLLLNNKFNEFKKLYPKKSKKKK